MKNRTAKDQHAQLANNDLGLLQDFGDDTAGATADSLFGEDYEWTESEKSYIPLPE